MKIFHPPMKKEEEEEEEKRVGVKGREREGVECGCVRVGARERVPSKVTKMIEKRLRGR